MTNCNYSYIIQIKVNSIKFRPHNFRPTFNKHNSEICYGIQFHIEEPANINLFNLGICFLHIVIFITKRVYLGKTWI